MGGDDFHFRRTVSLYLTVQGDCPVQVTGDKRVVWVVVSIYECVCVHIVGCRGLKHNRCPV